MRGNIEDAIAKQPGQVFDISIVLWTGQYGGAEVWSLTLAKELSRQGNSVGIVFVGDAGPLGEGALDRGIERTSLGLSRGYHVALRARSFARAVSRLGADAAILPSAGYLSAALRLGGYRGRIVAVEHGAMLRLAGLPPRRRLIRWLDWRSGIWAIDAQVVPSDFMKAELRKYPHCEHIARIYPGLDLRQAKRLQHVEAGSHGSERSLIVGCAARLVEGKGIEVLLRAAAACRIKVKVRVAGDGVQRIRLIELAQSLGIADRALFEGWVPDMDAFWNSCDVAVVPTDTIAESFGMVAIEAMASGLPVIASRRGGLIEIVEENVTGALFEPGDWQGLAETLERYASAELRGSHGRRARERCYRLFSIDRCAREFTRVIEEAGSDDACKASRVGAVA
jgi:glycosyltransferase involved in cell wall biosynthesis